MRGQGCAFHSLVWRTKGALTRPNNFMMIPQACRFGYPEGVDPNKFTPLTAFSSARDQWMHSKCINIHDSQSRVYELTSEYDGLESGWVHLPGSSPASSAFPSRKMDRLPASFREHDFSRVPFRGCSYFVMFRPPSLLAARSFLPLQVSLQGS